MIRSKLSDRIERLPDDAVLTNALNNLGFRLVYQSGHQNVYCSRGLHVWTSGGKCALAGVRFLRLGACDCFEYTKES